MSKNSDLREWSFITGRGGYSRVIAMNGSIAALWQLQQQFQTSEMYSIAVYTTIILPYSEMQIIEIYEKPGGD